MTSNIFLEIKKAVMSEGLRPANGIVSKPDAESITLSELGHPLQGQVLRNLLFQRNIMTNPV